MDEEHDRTFNSNKDEEDYSEDCDNFYEEVPELAETNKHTKQLLLADTTNHSNDSSVM